VNAPTTNGYRPVGRRYYLRAFWWPLPTVGGVGLFLMLFGRPAASIPAFGAGLVAATIVLLIAEGCGL